MAGKEKDRKDKRGNKKSPKKEAHPSKKKKAQASDPEVNPAEKAGGTSDHEEKGSEFTGDKEAATKDEAEEVPEITPDQKEESPRRVMEENIQEKSTEPRGSDSGENIVLVAIGASAGGLEALERFFENMDSDSGLAFAIIQHLDPSHKSYMAELISRYTDMSVKQVEDKMVVESNTVYVIPPNRYMGVMNGRLHLLEPTNRSGPPAPIDFFFRSMAEELKEKAICIVLSGTGSEGAMGLRAVKGAGGTCMVQDPETADYDGMPQSALNTGLVDYVLPPESMPDELLRFLDHAFNKKSKRTEKTDKDMDSLDKLYMLVRGQTGHDFSQYKKTTIRRRVERRMAVHRIASLDNYIKHIRENPREADQLYKEQLIGVTNFFRDPEAFESLKETVIPELFEKKGNQNPIRVWVPAASTGEEAYSLAILLRDYMNHSDQDHDVQIFATDLDEDAVEHARHGVFPQSVATDVPAQYLKRYFAQENSSFSVRREVRELIVFAPQNIASDPPFSRMDLISCRNLLIYLESSLQERLLWTFHYALRQGGFLFLGSSETVGKFHEQFDPIDRKWKIFRKRDQRNGAHVGPRALIPFKPKVPAPAKRVKKAPKKLENLPLQVTERHIIDKYAPPALIVNEKNRIIFIYGHAGKFIEPPAGDFTDNVVDLIKKELRLALSNTLRKVSSQGVETRSDKLFISLQGTDYIVRLLVSPITEPTDMQGHLIIFFEEKQWQGSEESDKKIHEGKEGSRKAQELEHELKSTREYLQTTIEELETSNEELQSTNEELQSSNEELQSTNEELETSKEELQSVNEELRTVNAELQQKIDELSKTSNDLNNLLASTDIGTVFLDSDMKIKRFTPKISDFINLIDTDIGRPLEHLATRLQRHDIVSFAKEVFNKLESRETEVQTDSGNWYLMRILPYRTSDNYVDGVVITFVDITSQKELERELSRMSNVFMEFPDPIIIEDTNGWVQQINNEAKEMYGWRKEVIMGKDGNILVKPECQEELAEYRNMALKGLKTRNREIVRIRKNGDQVKVLTSIFALSDEKGGFEGLAFIDRALPD